MGNLGCLLCRLLAATGHDVTREFYYNDAGAQIDNLALSVQARCKGLGPDDSQWPQDGYRGDYIVDLAKAYLAGETVDASDQHVEAASDADDLDSIRQFAVAYLRREQDPQDARQIVLFFTPQGATLIADSVSSVSDLRAEFVDIVGESAMHKTTSTLRTLYHGFGLESEIFNHGNTTDIQQLAQQLRARLDASDCHALGKLLLRTTGNGTQQLR